MQNYRSKDWASFRSEVFRLDNNTCTKCGRTPSDGIILQVHHKEYIQGHKPWDYPYELCETTCKGCHASIHGIIAPKFGWEHVGWDDFGSLDGTCECCGTSIRYIFLVQHESWHPMEVGEICCDHLTSTEVASSHMESTRRFIDRRKRFVSSSRWALNHRDNYQIKQKNFYIEVLSKENEFKLCINGKKGKLLFPSSLEARIKAFDIIESGELEKYYLEKRVRLHPKSR